MAAAAAKLDRLFIAGCGFHRPHLPFVFPAAKLDLYPLESIELPADDPLAVPGGASRVHVGCVLWPRAAEEEVCVLYHVTSGAAAPARLNCGPRSLLGIRLPQVE